MIVSEFLETFSSSIALASSDARYSYLNLITKINEYKLHLKNVRAGEVILLIGDYNLESIAFLFAALESKMILAILESDKLGNEIRNYASFIFSKVDSDYSLVEINKQPSDHPLLSRIKSENCAGLIYFTSGTNGDPKFVVHNFDLFLNQVSIPSQRHISILFLKFNHFGGLNTLLPILLSGGTLVIPKKKDPESIFNLVYQEKVTLLPVTPSFLGMALAMDVVNAKNLNSLKVISYGAEPIDVEVLKAWNLACPSIKFHQTYGMTETGTLRTKSNKNDSSFFSLSEKSGKFRVVENMLELKLSYCMLGYLNAPSPFTPDGWLKTGDQVEIQENSIKVIGRTSETIYISGEKVSPHSLESFISKVKGVISVKVYGVNTIITQNYIVAEVYTFKENQNDEFANLIKRICIKELPFYMVPSLIIFYDPIDMDEFKKVRKLKQQI